MKKLLIVLIGCLLCGCCRCPAPSHNLRVVHVAAPADSLAIYRAQVRRELKAILAENRKRFTVMYGLDSLVDSSGWWR